MIDYSSLIYTRVKNAVKDICKSSSTTNLSSPPAFPHLYFNQIDNPTVGTNLSNNECAVEPMVEIRVYTKGNTAETDAKKVINLADTEMRKNGFIRKFGPTGVDNVSDNSVTQKIARYSRLIGSGDKM